MSAGKTGRVVWRDLFTPDRPEAMAFYARVAGWRYHTEHARDGAWGGGARDFVLALHQGEAGAGFVETPEGLDDGWIPHVEVKDVDAAAATGARCGGTVVKPPFEVPGVGRNCLLKDPAGASVGVALSRHAFPAPTRQFGVERYLSADPALLAGFYAPVLGWAVSDESDTVTATTASGEAAARHQLAHAPLQGRARWLPCVYVADIDASIAQATALGGDILHDAAAADATRGVVLRDPQGAWVCLSCAPPHGGSTMTP